MHTLAGRLSRAAARKLLSPRRQSPWPHSRPFTAHGPPRPHDGLSPLATSPLSGALVPKSACNYIALEKYHSSSRESVRNAVEEAVAAWRSIVTPTNSQARLVHHETPRRPYATEPKRGDAFDPLKEPRSGAASRGAPQELHGNSFVFVAARRENVFTLWWKRVVEAARAVAALGQVPLVPLLLGFGGAVPFVALAPPLSSHAPLPEALKGRELEAQAAYGACILSFLGAPHWGLAMASHADAARPRATLTASSLRYTWSVVPALLAWPALLMPPVQKLALLLSSFGLTLGVDTAMAGQALLPKWYLPLRVALTLVAMLSMGASLSVAVANAHKPSSPASIERREVSH